VLLPAARCDDVVLPLAEIKKRLSEIVDGVEERHDRVVLTRNGRPAAVIISPEELESLEDTLDILSDPRWCGPSAGPKPRSTPATG
jgi:prevent-host-death family protein